MILNIKLFHPEKRISPMHTRCLFLAQSFNYRITNKFLFSAISSLFLTKIYNPKIGTGMVKIKHLFL